MMIVMMNNICSLKWHLQNQRNGPWKRSISKILGNIFSFMYFKKSFEFIIWWNKIWKCWRKKLNKNIWSGTKWNWRKVNLKKRSCNRKSKNIMIPTNRNCYWKNIKTKLFLITGKIISKFQKKLNYLKNLRILNNRLNIHNWLAKILKMMDWWALKTLAIQSSFIWKIK
jgi:hypothetical protein